MWENLIIVSVTHRGIAHALNKSFRLYLCHYSTDAGSVDTLMLEEMCKNPKDSEAPEHSGILSCVSQNSPEGKTLSTSMIEASGISTKMYHLCITYFSWTNVKTYFT